MILDRFRLDDKVAVVTGGGRGLGAASAIAFAEAGADVVLASRTKSDLDAVAETVASLGRRAHVVVADLSDTGACANLAAEAVEQFGRLDIVVNNVGGAMPKPLLDTTPEELAEAFSFNVLTAHALTTAAVPHLLNVGGGSIINVTSAVGRMPGRAFAAYGASKAALAHYTRITALDLSPKIRVNAIAPGSVLTSALDIVAGNEEIRTQLESATPLKRLGDPEDVAVVALWLASPAGSFITGKIIEVDGGLNTLNLVIPIPDL